MYTATTHCVKRLLAQQNKNALAYKRLVCRLYIVHEHVQVYFYVIHAQVNRSAAVRLFLDCARAALRRPI